MDENYKTKNKYKYTMGSKNKRTVNSQYDRVEAKDGGCIQIKGWGKARKR